MKQTVHALCTPWHATVAAALRETPRTLFATIRSWLDEGRRSRCLRADLQALQALDEFTLHDLGLHRSEIRSLLSSRARDERRHHAYCPLGGNSLHTGAGHAAVISEASAIDQAAERTGLTRHFPS